MFQTKKKKVSTPWNVSSYNSIKLCFTKFVFEDILGRRFNLSRMWRRTKNFHTLTFPEENTLGYCEWLLHCIPFLPLHKSSVQFYFKLLCRGKIVYNRKSSLMWRVEWCILLLKWCQNSVSAASYITSVQTLVFWKHAFADRGRLLSSIYIVCCRVVSTSMMASEQPLLIPYRWHKFTCK
jgi:hypothetical protein